MKNNNGAKKKQSLDCRWLYNGALIVMASNDLPRLKSLIPLMLNDAHLEVPVFFV